MKRRKVGPIGIVIDDDALRAAQVVDGKLVTAAVPAADSLKKCLRQLRSSAAFVGRDVAVGLDGSAVLVESVVLPAGAAKDARKVCADRLKGDPLFNSEKSLLGVAVENMPSVEGSSLAVMTAMNRERLEEVMKACRDAELDVQSVEAAALAAWRGWVTEGLQVRLIRAAGTDVIQAGIGDKLLFCRVVPAPIEGEEVSKTVARAASLLGADGFDRLSAAGLDEAERESVSELLDMPVEPPATAIEDVAALGTASEGTVLADFTPPEERALREKRKARKVSVVMAAACGMLVLVVGLLGTQRISSLQDRKVALEQQREIMRADKVQLEQLQAQLAREEANEAVISSASPGHRMSTMFTIVAEAATDGVFLETVKIDDIESPDVTDAQRAAGPTLRFLEVRLNGLASSSTKVRQFADSLLSTGAFVDVRVEASESVLLGVGIDGERFRIYASAETH